MITQWFPQIGVIHKRYVFCWPTVGQAMTHHFITTSPLFVAALSEVNLSVDNSLTIIQVGLKRAIGIENAASSTELNAPLLAVAICGDEVNTVFKGTGHPPAARTFLIKPIGGEE